jgi:hypothetical protein
MPPTTSIRRRAAPPGPVRPAPLLPCLALSLIACTEAAAAAPQSLQVGTQFSVVTTMKCLVRDDGRLSDCLIETRSAEVPGLDARILASAAMFRMRPYQADGRPVAGATIRPQLVYVCPRANPSASHCKYTGLVPLRRP